MNMKHLDWDILDSFNGQNQQNHQHHQDLNQMDQMDHFDLNVNPKHFQNDSFSINRRSFNVPFDDYDFDESFDSCYNFNPLPINSNSTTSEQNDLSPNMNNTQQNCFPSYLDSNTSLSTLFMPPESSINQNFSFPQQPPVQQQQFYNNNQTQFLMNYDIYSDQDLDDDLLSTCSSSLFLGSTTTDSTSNSSENDFIHHNPSQHGRSYSSVLPLNNNHVLPTRKMSATDWVGVSSYCFPQTQQQSHSHSEVKFNIDDNYGNSNLNMNMEMNMSRTLSEGGDFGINNLSLYRPQTSTDNINYDVDVNDNDNIDQKTLREVENVKNSINSNNINTNENITEKNDSIVDFLENESNSRLHNKQMKMKMSLKRKLRVKNKKIKKIVVVPPNPSSSSLSPISPNSPKSSSLSLSPKSSSSSSSLSPNLNSSTSLNYNSNLNLKSEIEKMDTGIIPLETIRGKNSKKQRSNFRKKNICPYCSKEFSRPSSLQTHTYTHTGEKPFICDFDSCGKKFSVRSNLVRHMKLHDNEINTLHSNDLNLHNTNRSGHSISISHSNTHSHSRNRSINSRSKVSDDEYIPDDDNDSL